jgi:hypothetical protein
MKKYYSLRVVLAETEEEAIEKVLDQDFDEADPLCDKCVTRNEMIRSTIEECRTIEDKVLKVWHARAKAQGYNPKSKKARELQAEFMFGMVAALDVLTDAETTGESSISPRVMFSVMRGEYIQ